MPRVRTLVAVWSFVGVAMAGVSAAAAPPRPSPTPSPAAADVRLGGLVPGAASARSAAAASSRSPACPASRSSSTSAPPAAASGRPTTAAPTGGTSPTAIFGTASVGALAVAPSDPNVIYVGMGETPIRGNVSHGDGVYKSTDAGKTWTHVGLDDTRHIGKSPRPPARTRTSSTSRRSATPSGPNPERGVYRTHGRRRDLGATSSSSATKPAPSTSSIDPTNPRILYAALLGGAAHALDDSSSGGPGSGLWQVDRRRRHLGASSTGNRACRKGVVGKIGVAVSPAQSGPRLGASSRPRRAASTAPTTAARPGSASTTTATCASAPGTTPTSTPTRRTPTRSTCSTSASASRSTAARPSTAIARPARRQPRPLDRPGRTRSG